MNKENGISVILCDGGEYLITKDQIEYYTLLYPDLDVKSELEYLKRMWKIEALPRKTAKNITKYINKWLSKQNEENR